MPPILYGAPHLPEFETERILDDLESWLTDMVKKDLLKIDRKQNRLTIMSPNWATVIIERVNDRLDMSRVLLGMRFSLRIVKMDKQWEILDKHGMHQPLEPETFYAELRDLLEAPGPCL